MNNPYRLYDSLAAFLTEHHATEKDMNAGRMIVELDREWHWWNSIGMTPCGLIKYVALVYPADRASHVWCLPLTESGTITTDKQGSPAPLGQWALDVPPKTRLLAENERQTMQELVAKELVAWRLLGHDHRTGRP